MPTNCFCGPIELRDGTGRRLRLLKPQVASSNAYPATYNSQTERSNHFRLIQWYPGPKIFPPPLFATSTRSELVRFQLGGQERPPGSTLFVRWFQLAEYFDLKDSGEYTLTVWPKIYRRSETNRDICIRMNLPPVTASFRWEPARLPP
jgi:hypothetical protein